MRKYLENQIKRIVGEELASRTVTSSGAVLPVGYNPLEKIRGALFHWIAVPFNGLDVWCQLRCPNATQLETCGDMTSIVNESKNTGNLSREDILNIRDYQEAICKLVLNRPTYDQIASLAGSGDFVISAKQRELEEAERLLEAQQEALSETEQAELHARLEKAKLIIGYILPDDTMAFLTRWGMGNDVSEIKTITRDMFIRAASLARLHHKAPTEYLSGVFTDYNKSEIDAYAYSALEEFLKTQKAVAGNYRWIRLGGTT